MVNGDRPVTIHDVANLAGVAVSSVSRVLSKHPDVSEKMRIKVEAAARELGYSPDPVARSLRSGSSRLIGYVVRDFQTPFFNDVIEGLEAVLTAEGYTLLVLNGGGQQTKELERISVLKQRRVDGLFLSTLVDSTSRLREAVKAFGRPVVLIDRDLPGVDVGRAQFDHAGRRQRGHRRSRGAGPHPHRHDHRRSRRPPDARTTAWLPGGPCVEREGGRRLDRGDGSVLR